MKLLAINAISKIANRTHTKIWLRSSEDNMDHDPWFSLARSLWCYSGEIVLKKKLYLEQSRES